jgi:hypothetical protein
MPDNVVPEKIVNWNKINLAKAAARKIADEKERAEITSAEEERSRLSSISILRWENFLRLLISEIGDLTQEFTITSYDSLDVLHSDVGLCTQTKVAFYLMLPEHNPITTIVQYGFMPTTLGEGDRITWNPSDTPYFVPNEQKWHVYPDPKHRQQVVRKIRSIQRIGILDLANVRDFASDDIGEALLTAERLYRVSQSLPATETYDELSADSVSKDEPEQEYLDIPFHGEESLVERLQKLFTLHSQAIDGAATSTQAKRPRRTLKIPPADL